MAQRSYSVSFHSPPDIRFSLANMDFTLRFGSWFSCGAPSFHEVDMQYGESVVVRPKRKQALRWFVDRLYELRRLLSLLMVEPVRLERIQLQYGSHLEPAIGKMIKDYAGLLFRQSYHDTRIRDLHTFSIPFHFRLVRRCFQQNLVNWFERYDELKPVFDLFFLPIYNKNLNIEFRFLGILQALEALHRVSVGGAYMSLDKYDSVWNRLVSSIPDTVSNDHKAALKSRIKYGYEFSLRKRLMQLSKSLSTEAMYLATGGEVPSRFLGRVVITRNYLTHYDKALEEDSMSPKEMIRANHSLMLFLMLLIFQEIQIPEETSLVRLRESGLLKHPQFTNREDLP